MEAGLRLIVSPCLGLSYLGQHHVRSSCPRSQHHVAAYQHTYPGVMMVYSPSHWVKINHSSFELFLQILCHSNKESNTTPNMTNVALRISRQWSCSLSLIAVISECATELGRVNTAHTLVEVPVQYFSPLEWRHDVTQPCCYCSNVLLLI